MGPHGCRFLSPLISQGPLGFLRDLGISICFEWMKLNRKKPKVWTLGPSRIQMKKTKKTTKVWTYWSLNMPMLAAEQIAEYCRMRQNKMFPCFPWVKIDTSCFNRRTCIWVRHFSLSDRSRSSYQWFLHGQLVTCNVLAISYQIWWDQLTVHIIFMHCISH